MNRRAFLSSLIPAAIVLTDPEELLWKPVKKIFIPPISQPLFAYSRFQVDVTFTKNELWPWLTPHDVQRIHNYILSTRIEALCLKPTWNVNEILH